MAGDATIVAGRRVAERYRLVASRGEGAWDAVDETLKRNVVVHVLAADAGEAAKAHFTDEARTLARLNHRNVVATYDTGVDGDGTSYRVDELAGGRALDLHAVDDAHRLAYARQIAQALADAHAVGLVHGGLKSSHVLVGDEGRVQIRGFRLPAAADADGARRRDIDALVTLIVGLAPPGRAPLRDLALGWRTTAPDSAVAMLDALAGIDDDDFAVPDPAPTPATGVPPVARQRRSRTVLIVGLAAAAAAALAAALLLPATNEAGDFDGPVTKVNMTARSFDPEGSDRTENETEARLVVDDDPTTAWATERYRSANFGNLKDGLGLILQTQAGSVEFSDLVIASPTRGWDVQIFVAEQPAATLAGWGEPVASATVQGQATTIALPQRPSGAALLVWIPDPGRNLQVRISEVTVQGRS